MAWTREKFISLSRSRSLLGSRTELVHIWHCWRSRFLLCCCSTHVWLPFPLHLMIQNSFWSSSYCIYIPVIKKSSGWAHFFSLRIILRIYTYRLIYIPLSEPIWPPVVIWPRPSSRTDRVYYLTLLFSKVMCAQIKIRVNWLRKRRRASSLSYVVCHFIHTNNNYYSINLPYNK